MRSLSTILGNMIDSLMPIDETVRRFAQGGPAARQIVETIYRDLLEVEGRVCALEEQLEDDYDDDD